MKPIPRLLMAAMALSAPICRAEDPENIPDESNVPETVSTPLHSENLVKVSSDVRIDYQHEWTDGRTVDANSGFEGKYFMLKVEGTITDGLTYVWRQRLNKYSKDAAFFDATDWLCLDYAYRRFNFNAGKSAVAIGGWEYDRYPVDVYAASLFWQSVSCFQLGASVGYNITPSQRLTLQVGQSMFHTSENRNLYSYNLLWTGTMGCLSTISSVNMTEYAPNHYINYIALGQRLTLGRFTVEADLMNRAARHQPFLLRDVTVIGEVAYQPNERWRIHGKYTYDANRSGTDADMLVLNGTELSMAGGGVEFFPLVKKRTSLRVHACCYHSWGRNANTADVMQNGSTMMSVGVKWHMDIFSVKRN